MAENGLLSSILDKYAKKDLVLAASDPNNRLSAVPMEISDKVASIDKQEAEIKKAFDKAEELLSLLKMKENDVTVFMSRRGPMKGKLEEFRQNCESSVLVIDYDMTCSMLEDHIDILVATIRKSNVMYAPTDPVPDIAKEARDCWSTIMMMMQEISAAFAGTPYGDSVEQSMMDLQMDIDMLTDSSTSSEVTALIQTIHDETRNAYNGLLEINKERVSSAVDILGQFQALAEGFKADVIKYGSIDYTSTNVVGNLADSFVIFTYCDRLPTYTADVISQMSFGIPTVPSKVREAIGNLQGLIYNMERECRKVFSQSSKARDEIVEYEREIMASVGYVPPTPKAGTPDLGVILGLLPNYSAWKDAALEKSVFQTEGDAQRYLAGYICEDERYVASKIVKALSSSGNELWRLNGGKYDQYYLSDRIIETQAVENLSLSDFILNNTKTFTISVIFPSVSYFFGKGIWECVDIGSPPALRIEREFMYALSKDFMDMTLKQKESTITSCIRYVLGRARTDISITFSECLFCIVLMKFMDYLKGSPVLSQDLKSNISALNQEYLADCQSWLSEYVQLYKDIFVNKVTPSFYWLAQSTSIGEVSSWLQSLEATSLSDVVPILDYSKFA